ncbi:putative glycosyltransferase EpsD [Desulfosporosinus acididurans]|uniref:Putative glycosyltransferase EpsD n=1 Tax=Desulfosporosinus acididurans TaxID=476652 RepID=A0A0J1IP40_9FIRM|nr:GT4 family glycosyltransferase PelF [Desulfosporosinus acididurans]KLU66431.1 putative glycosyltransferase EpsD [Desulfosporosinus acididurans]
MTNGKIKVMLTTEGTFPFHQGGVSTWSNVLVQGLPSVDYVVYSIIMNPYVTQKFTLPANATLIKVPLWGTEDPSEHLTTPFSKTYLAKKRTDPGIINSQFLPLFKEMIREILSIEKNPISFANILYDMYRYFKQYDYKNSFKDEVVWSVFKETIFQFSVNSYYKLPEPSVFDIIQSLGWIYRFFTILNTPLPRVDITHSAAAAFCGIPAVLAKLEYKTPFLLTEHGVYLREQYLNINRSGYTAYLKTFLIRFVHSITSLNYFMADQVSPVCQYNTRWERRFGVDASKIKVIYNGVDKDVFAPSRQRNISPHPTVVSVARIDPVKDIITLIKAASSVREQFPEVRFIVYGSVTVPEYYEECLSIRKQLGLNETFIFAGHSDNVPSVLADGDVIALTSITEAFPYAVVEAMMAGKPLVATEVGGVKEAIADCGIVVTPRHYDQMAKSIITLLKNPELRQKLGDEARKRALDLFTIERSLRLYSVSYYKLINTFGQPQIFILQLQRQKLLSDKGYALLELGYWNEAIIQFKNAIEAYLDSNAVPVLMMEIAYAYNELGDYESALIFLKKAKNLNGKYSQEKALKTRLARQRILVDKGYALLELGYWRDAIDQFEKAINIHSNSSAVPLLLLEISHAYNELGELDRARDVLAKVQILAEQTGVQTLTKTS